MTSDELYDLLDSLGGTVNVVAARLLAEGCVGMPCMSGTCPVAKFVGREMHRLGMPAVLSVGPKRVNVFLHGGLRLVSAECPPAVAGLIYGFDNGGFPELRVKV